jgi:hypothetical protein
MTEADGAQDRDNRFAGGFLKLCDGRAHLWSYDTTRGRANGT